MTKAIGQAAVSLAPASPRMSVAEYDGLIESGVIDEKAPVELIEGRIVGKMGKGPRHSIASQKLQRVLAAALGPGSGWMVWVENPVALPGRDSEPEPDVSLVRGEPDDYEAGQPSPPAIGLVVEVADSSLAADRALAETYLSAGVPTYWLVNIPGRSLEVYTPAGRVIVLEGNSTELVLDGVVVAQIAVADILPRRLK